MKGVINTFLNRRILRPSVNSSNPDYYAPGEVIEIVDIVNGDEYEGNKIWFKLNNGSYVWSGGIEGSKSIIPDPDMVRSKKDTELKPDDIDIPMYFKFFGINKLWDETMGEGVDIAVLDTGVDRSHLSFKTRITSGKNFIKNNNAIDDFDGHGTHCAGIIASNGINEAFGIAPKINLHVGKITNFRTDGIVTSILIKAIKWYLNKVDIISLSGGISEPHEGLQGIIQESKNTKTIIVSAIGNSNTRKIGDYPAEYDDCIAVGALEATSENNFKLWERTIHSDNLTVCAPGVDILSSDINNSFSVRTGTSMACPFISGVLGLLRKKLLSKKEVLDEFNNSLVTVDNQNSKFLIFKAN
jgi:subtilisin family serine protease